MKFWHKISIYSSLLFLVIFNFGAVCLIQNSHNLNLKREIDRSLDEHRNISTGISYYNTISNNYLYIESKNRVKADYKEVIKKYLEKLNAKNNYLEIVDKNNHVVFSNLDYTVSQDREELTNASHDKRKYIIRDVENKTLLFVTSLININGEDLKFSYVRDVTYIYEDKKEQYNFYIRLSISITIILAIGMYMLSRYITRPIEKLINITQIVSKGNYSKRVEIDSKDEIGILAENFNEMAAAVEQKISELEMKAAEKQRFIDNLTHELKTPLTSIIGYADFLRLTAYNEQIFIEGLNHIFKEGKRLEELSWKMMELMSLEREKFKMRKENIGDILFDINDILKPRLESKSIHLMISGEDYEVVVERDLIRNFICNFIDNSIKASKEGSNIYLHVYENKENKTVLEIKDEGIGISEEDLSKVFEAFYMADKSRTRANNGVGLGLTICSEIAKIHEIELEMESQLNKGTIISITFTLNS
ncbi:sensor histidine kinase [Bacillus toyonensis]|uniref:sensor histidine kinase n=1 Tax=Bacillus toyonensis TaxID=155322 RepID=UPI00259EB095|nr:HAMP domain-containing sensor histidine kinase [Bacillus toyonensis]MDM5259440.1 HAMP domain-containing sensor histidine kinase [Bacillus toyonensis]